MNKIPPSRKIDCISISPDEISLVLPTHHLMKHLSDEQKGPIFTPESKTYVLDGDWDQYLDEKFENEALYTSLKDHIQSGVEWSETFYYKRKLRRVNELRLAVRVMNREKTEREAEPDPRKKKSIKKRIRMVRKERKKLEKILGDKRTEQDLVTEMALFTELYQEIKEKGYLSQGEIYRNGGYWGNEISVAINRKGKVLFVDGQHRLAIAKILRIKSIPVQVVIRHTRWNAFRGKVLAYAQTHKGKVYQRIDHPDLAVIPFHHGPERGKMITKALKNHKKGWKVIDIGAHWGHMCHILEDLGYECTAVEANKHHIPFLKGQREARGKRFTVWEGSIFNYPKLKISRNSLRPRWRKFRGKRPLHDPLRPLGDEGLTWLSDFDMILALNVFHHFIKTEKGHQQLIELLSEMDANTIFFEPHLQNEGQMKGAYRNYSPDEFAAFVAKHARMRHVENLGVAGDGRTLYILTKKPWIHP